MPCIAHMQLVMQQQGVLLLVNLSALGLSLFSMQPSVWACKYIWIAAVYMEFLCQKNKDLNGLTLTRSQEDFAKAIHLTTPLSI